MIIIAGGGISGLSAAYFLKKSGFDCLVLEQSSEVGGCILSESFEEYLLESGPNSLLYSDYLDQLFNDLELSNEVLPSSAVNKKRFIYKGGNYKKLPSGPFDLLFGNFFSTATKYKIFTELFRKPGRSENEDLQSFFVAHFGKEVADYALNPFVSGIYAGDPEKLLVAETFPSLIKFEKENGSLLKGMIKNAGSRKKLVSLKGGLQLLPKKMAEKLTIKYNSKVVSVNKKEQGFVITYLENGQNCIIDASHIVLALPAYSIGEILNTSYAHLSKVFSAVHYPPMVVVHTVYNRSDVSHSLDGFGGLNPKVENRFAAGSIWTSSVFPFRAPEDSVLITTFVGGSQYEAAARLPDTSIRNKVDAELKENFGIIGEPLFQKTTRWPKALPQYDKHILEVKKAAAILELAHLYICSNIFDGVSLEDCIRKGEKVSKKIIAQESGKPSNPYI